MKNAIALGSGKEESRNTRTLRGRERCLDYIGSQVLIQAGGGVGRGLRPASLAAKPE